MSNQEKCFWKRLMIEDITVEPPDEYWIGDPPSEAEEEAEPDE